jgi:hypothetical protein
VKQEQSEHRRSKKGMGKMEEDEREEEERYVTEGGKKMGSTQLRMMRIRRRE